MPETGYHHEEQSVSSPTVVRLVAEDGGEIAATV
jgi:hypothetical protein